MAQLPTKRQVLYMLYFIARYLVICTSYFLSFICVLYGIGPFIMLSATQFYCKSYSRDEIYSLNRENGRERGVRGNSCLVIGKASFDEQALEELDIKIFDATFTIRQLSFTITIQCMIYFIISLFLFIIATYFGFYLIYDTYYALKWSKGRHSKNGKNGKNGKNSRNAISNNPRIVSYLVTMAQQRRKIRKQHKLKKKHSTDNRHKNSNNDEKNKFILWIQTCQTKFIEPYYYIDSKWYLFGMYIRELIEILVQFYVLLSFGGIDFVNINANIQGQDASIVEGMFLLHKRSIATQLILILSVTCNVLDTCIL